MNTPFTLIDQLRQFAATAPQGHQPRLNRQAIASGEEFIKQWQRYAAFLKLTREYANRFLSDLSEEIQQQSSFLDALKRRLVMATALREQAVDLRKLYEDEPLDCIKKVRHTGTCPTQSTIFATRY